MPNRNRILTLSIIMLFNISLVGCSGSEKKEKNADKNNVEEEKKADAPRPETTVEQISYHFSKEDQFDIEKPVSGLSFNEFWGLILNQPTYCQGNEECMNQPFEGGSCLVSTKPVEITGKGQVEVTVEYATTALQWVSNPLQIESKPLFSIYLNADIDGKQVELESKTVHLLELPFHYEADEKRPNLTKLFFSTTGFSSFTLKKSVANQEGASQIKVSLCNANTFNLTIKKISLETKRDL